jgi:hypothetical protein
MEIEAAEGPCQAWIPALAGYEKLGSETMKYLLMAGGFAAALGLSQMTLPAQAQGDVRQLCQNKHGLGKYGTAASEARRKEAAAKIAACIKSGGKT